VARVWARIKRDKLEGGSVGTPSGEKLG
jgi:hypothetical protein